MVYVHLPRETASFSLLIYITRGLMSFVKEKNIIIKTLNNNKTISCSMHLASVRYMYMQILSLKKIKIKNRIFDL